MAAKQSAAMPERVRLLVHAPMLTKEILRALEDWEPLAGVKFTLVKRKSFTLLFEVSCASGFEARGLAHERLKEKGLSETPQLDMCIV